MRSCSEGLDTSIHRVNNDARSTGPTRSPKPRCRVDRDCGRRRGQDRDLGTVLRADLVHRIAGDLTDLGLLVAKMEMGSTWLGAID